MMTFVEDEWHTILVCPLYDGLRRTLPFTAESVRVEGHRLQGAGCTPRNLLSLVRSIMQAPRFDGVVYNLSPGAEEAAQLPPAVVGW